MSDDWQLAQGTVDFRNEERRAWNRGPQETTPPTLRIYVLDTEARHRQIAECGDESLAFTLRTLIGEGQIACNSEIGIFDLRTRAWIVNPWPATPFGNRRQA